MSRNRMLGLLPLALHGLPNDRLDEALELMKLLGSENGPAWAAYLKKVRESGLPNQPEQPQAPKPSVLKLVSANIQLDSVAAYDPSLFKTRPGLWVSDEFVSGVGSKAKPVKDLSAITLSSLDITKNAYDKEITADPAMPANYKFESESEFVAYLDQMIQKQSKGEVGDLLNNGYWNIFYVAGCVVRVFWRFDYRKWSVRAWGLDDCHWYADYRAFGRN